MTAGFGSGGMGGTPWWKVGDARIDPPEEWEPRCCGQCDEWVSHDGEIGFCQAKAFEWEQRALMPGTVFGDYSDSAAEFAMDWLLDNLIGGDTPADGCDGWREED